MAKRINQILRDDPGAAGVAITHGTATLEETAYFLNLTVRSNRPVVITGAMRPPTGLGTDSDVNLIDCIRVAAAPQSAGRGVLTVLNNQIQAARDVTSVLPRFTNCSARTSADSSASGTRSSISSIVRCSPL